MITDYSIRSRITPCLSRISTNFRNDWSSIQIKASLDLMQITCRELNQLNRECLAEIESITNDVIDCRYCIILCHQN